MLFLRLKHRVKKTFMYNGVKLFNNLPVSIVN